MPKLFLSFRSSLENDNSVQPFLCWSTGRLQLTSLAINLRILRKPFLTPSSSFLESTCSSIFSFSFSQRNVATDRKTEGEDLKIESTFPESYFRCLPLYLQSLDSFVTETAMPIGICQRPNLETWTTIASF